VAAGGGAGPEEPQCGLQDVIQPGVSTEDGASRANVLTAAGEARALVALVEASFFPLDLAKQAVPLLLHHLESLQPALRKCCPAAAAATPIGLLHMLRAEVAVAEVVSSFIARSPGQPHGPRFWFGPSLEELGNRSSFDNLWQAWLREGVDLTQFSDYVDRLDDLEVNLYGLKPFARRGAPASPVEASERGAYCKVNLIGSSAGSPIYGDVSLVFSRNTIGRLTLLAPFDTGSWMRMCNTTADADTSGRFPISSADKHAPLGRRLRSLNPLLPSPYHHDCNAFEGHAGLGTLDAFEHLLLPSDQYWAGADSLLHKLRRLLSCPGTRPPMVGMDEITYLEAMPAATPQLPSDVVLVIGAFPSLFGSSDGELLRRWCRQHRWPLAWSLGLNLGFNLSLSTVFWSIGRSNATFDEEPFGRLLDVVVDDAATTNASVSPADRAAFSSAWARLRALRATNASATLEPSFWVSEWRALRVSVAPPLHVAPLRAGACADVGRCVAISMLGDCVCHGEAGASQLRKHTTSTRGEREATGLASGVAAGRRGANGSPGSDI